MKKNIILLVDILSIVLFCVSAGVKEYRFSKNCKELLKLAADSPTIEMSHGFLSEALQFMEEEELTEGNTAYIFDTPRTDVGIWYAKIKGAENTLNSLMKIREVILDGKYVTLPESITWFPNVWGMTLWIWFSIIFIVLGVGIQEID